MRVALAVRRAMTLVGAAALILAVAVAPALGASTPGWRVVQTIGSSSDATYMSLFAVSGKSNAWSTWGSCGPCGGSGPVQKYGAERWNGSTWKPVTVPSSLTGGTQAIVAVGTSATADTWLFTAQQSARWNGHAWSVRTLPSWVVRGNLSGETDVTPAVFGPSDVWVFSLGIDSLAKHPPAFAARYNGHTWAKVKLPAVPSTVAAVSRNDIWVLGIRPNGTAPLMHWNGRSWRTLAVPKATDVPAHATEFVRDLAAAGPRAVWLQRDVEQGTAGARTLYLLHWNGRRWQRVYLHYPTSSVDYLAQDGHGGIWIVANGPKPRYRWYLYHRSSSGRWTRQAVPATKGTTLQELDGLSWIPGTTSMWADGQVLVPNSSEGVIGAIWKYGK